MFTPPQKKRNLNSKFKTPTPKKINYFTPTPKPKSIFNEFPTLRNLLRRLDSLGVHIDKNSLKSSSLISVLITIAQNLTNSNSNSTNLNLLQKETNSKAIKSITKFLEKNTRNFKKEDWGVSELYFTPIKK